MRPKRDVTQSNLKAMLDYEAGECGLYTEAYIDGKLIKAEPSDAMKHGIYFEYLVTGSVPKSGIVPEPEVYLKSGKWGQAGEINATYKAIAEQAERIKTYLKRMGIKILESGTYKRNPELGIGGTLDILAAMPDGEVVVIDLKSGRIDDKWSRYGWSFSPVQVEYHKIQARHYHLLDGLRFFYLVCETVNESGQIRMFEAVIDDRAREEHKELVTKYREWEERKALVGLDARPELNRCEKCPLYDTCNERAIYPTIEQIKL